jgi:hypothetical protein
MYSLRGRFDRFVCQVALNDDVPPGSTHADFCVLTDGREVARASGIAPGQSPGSISVDLSGARILELVVTTTRWPYCHAVWLDPHLQTGSPGVSSNDGLTDCLGRADLLPPAAIPCADRCIATVVSPGFEPLLERLLASLHINGACRDALLVVLAVQCTQSCLRVAARYGATVIECRQRSVLNSTVKSVLYTLPALVDARHFVCLDADMLVLGNLRPLFGALETCPPGTILACREANGRGLSDLSQAIHCVYGGQYSDFKRILGDHNGEPTYPLVINDGLFAGSRNSLLAVDGLIRSWTNAARWVDERRDVWWRNQFVFNLALARLQCGVELDPVYNIQLNSQEVDWFYADQRPKAFWHGQQVRVLHFNGLGRSRYPEWCGFYAQESREYGDRPLSR